MRFPVKRIVTTLCCVMIGLPALIAQKTRIDSLNKVLTTAKEDTTRVNTLVSISFYDQNFQHALMLAEKALAIARNTQYKKGEANALYQIGNQYVTISNYPRALYYFLESLKIHEHLSEFNDEAACNESIGYVYKQQGDYEKAMLYYRKARSLYQDAPAQMAVLQGDFAYLFLVLNKRDSALKYFQSSYEMFNAIYDKYRFDVTLNGLGGLQFAMGNKELALGYYHEAETNGLFYQDTLGLSYTYYNLAKYYVDAKQHDSAVAYAVKCLFYAQRSNALENVARSGKTLASLFRHNNDTNALEYLLIAQSASDSLNSRRRLSEIQNLSFSENIRQEKIIEKEKLEAEERKHNIEYAGLALGIVVFIILFLLLSRTIIVNETLISFFTILCLLIVFEFINLLIHPHLAALTHESPLLMLLALVAIASLLIPLHHRLEHWVKEKMIEKNKIIRLAAAKKIIEQLGKENDMR